VAEEKKLYVPSKVPTEPERIRGYLQAASGCVITAVIALIAWIAKAVDLVIILIVLVGIATSCVLARKEDNGLSAIDTVADNLRFLFQLQRAFYAEGAPHLDHRTVSKKEDKSNEKK